MKYNAAERFTFEKKMLKFILISFLLFGGKALAQNVYPVVYEYRDSAHAEFYVRLVQFEGCMTEQLEFMYVRMQNDTSAIVMSNSNNQTKPMVKVIYRNVIKELMDLEYQANLSICSNCIWVLEFRSGKSKRSYSLSQKNLDLLQKFFEELH